MVFGVFIFIFIAGFIIAALFNSNTGAVLGAVLYGVSIIGTMLYVIIDRLDKILSMKEKD